MFINIRGKAHRQLPLVSPAWDGIAQENGDFILRLKRPDEEEAGLHRLVRLTGAQALPGYRLLLSFSDGESRVTRSLAQVRYRLSPESDEFFPLRELYTEEAFSRITFTHRYLILPDGRRLQPWYL